MSAADSKPAARTTAHQPPVCGPAPLREDGPGSRPEEQQLLLDAALTVIRAQGIARLTVADVLEAANLGTRAFYRHFKSKDQLIVTAFADSGRHEALRLEARMRDHDDPVDRIVAWIDCRLELAFDDTVESDLRHISGEAHTLFSVEPELMIAAYEAILSPLVEELRRGVARKRFANVDPVTDARAIQGVVWACIEQQWNIPQLDARQVRARTITFCLRAIGTSPKRIAAALAS